MDTVLRALEQANKCKQKPWRLWRYSAITGLLVLRGHRPTFNMPVSLRFQSPSYVCLPQWLDDVLFSLEPDGDEATLMNQRLRAASYRIYLRARGGTFSIDCEGIAVVRHIW